MHDGRANPAHHHGAGQSWDDVAQTYARQADQQEPAFRATTEALLDSVRAAPGVRLLDLACGPGHTTAAAHARGAAALGVDRSAGMIEQARRRFPAVAFAVGDMTSPPAGPWDAIVCRFGAHHVEPAWLGAAFRVLRQNGRIAIAENEPAAPNDPHNSPDGKVPLSEWRRRFHEAGFVDVSARTLPAAEATREDAASIEPVQSLVWLIPGRKP